MDTEHWRFGGGANESVLHPLVLVAMLAAIAVIICGRRRYALAAFLLSTFFIPSGQQVLIGGIHVFVFRFIVLAGCTRLFRRSDGPRMLAGGWNAIDWAFLLCILTHAIAFSLLYANGAAIVNQFGYIWDYAGGYLLLRHLLQDEQDVRVTVTCLAWVAIVCAGVMIQEQLSGQNLFGLLGGVRLQSQIREGRIRSEAVFQHAILAGTFAGTLLPLLIGVWPAVKGKLFWIVAIIATLVMAMTTACSTPVLTWGAALFAVCCWPFRNYTRSLRWGLLTVLVVLQFAMNAPVWALIQRVDIVHASSSYHRYQLVDQFMRHWQEWFVLGTKSNESWGAEMIDTSNAFVEEGTGGGALTLAFFIFVLAKAFGRAGTARKAAAPSDRANEWFFWCAGAAIFAHMTAFFGIYYFDQTRVAWFVVLAIVSSTVALGHRKEDPARKLVTLDEWKHPSLRQDEKLDAAAEAWWAR